MAGRKSISLPLFVALLTLAGCSGTPQPVTRTTPATPATPPPAAAPKAAEPQKPAAPAVREAEPARDDEAVVVDPGVEGSGPVTLAEAAKAERERRARAGKPVAVITDKTLPQYARKGQITVADPKKEKKGAAPPAAEVPAVGKEEAVRDEAYWRNRALEIRLRWRQAADDVKELEQRSTELRQRFYAETDSFVRDNQVKPEWDRVLDRLRQARTDVDTAKRDLGQLHEEGRMAGALPGWLREGEDHEPAPEPDQEKLPAPQSIEPPVLNDNGDNGGEEARK